MDVSSQKFKRAIKNSTHYNEALQYLTQAREGRDLKRKESSAVRYFILSRFFMDNDIRPGPLNDFHHVEEDGVTVMLVTPPLATCSPT